MSVVGMVKLSPSSLYSLQNAQPLFARLQALSAQIHRLEGLPARKVLRSAPDFCGSIETSQILTRYQAKMEIETAYFWFKYQIFISHMKKMVWDIYLIIPRTDKHGWGLLLWSVPCVMESIVRKFYLFQHGKWKNDERKKEEKKGSSWENASIYAFFVFGCIVCICVCMRKGGVCALPFSPAPCYIIGSWSWIKWHISILLACCADHQQKRVSNQCCSYLSTD